MVRARWIGLPSLRTEAVPPHSTAPPPPVGAPAPGANGTGSVYWFAFASHRGGAPTIERATPPRRSTRPGCERTGSAYSFAFASHRGGAPTIERVTHTPQGHPPRVRTGQARCFGLPSLRTEAVLLQSNASPPPCRSTRPGCEWYGLGVLVCLRFAPRRCSYNRTRHPHPP